jgi:hypothetical protein
MIAICSHLANGAASGNPLGVCFRESPNVELCCFNPLCSYTNSSEERMQAHILKEHNQTKKIKCKVYLFATLVAASSEGQNSKVFLQTSAVSDDQNNSSSFNRPEPTEFDDPANLASDEESTSDMSRAFSLGVGPARQRIPRLPVRPTPYKRTSDASSRSTSPIRRLSPLQIPAPLPHLSALSAAPSPLQRLAYSRPNSTTPPLSDNEMDVDDPKSPLDKSEIPFDEDKVLAKASFAIIPLSYLQAMPPTRLLTCTKCLHGVLPSSLISHSNEHHIKLLPAEKKNLQKIIDSSSFLDDSIEVSPPNPPCPPIEGILVQDGFGCNLCSHCCMTVGSMQTHFSRKHKGTLGSAKANYRPVQVQALFARRPKYFAVTPSLRGLNEEDLFTVYLQQCAPDIEALRILNPPLNPNEIPPLLKITQWQEHLKVYISDRDTVRNLLELTKIPTSKEGEAWLGSSLRATIEGYMKNVQVKARNASLGIKCLLKECPRFVLSLMCKVRL